MTKIRVLIANYPELVPEVICQAIEKQSDMEIVGDVRGPMRILQEVGRTKADAVILSTTASEEPALCSQLLSIYPDLTILGVATDFKTAFVKQLCPWRHDVFDLDSDPLLKTLRSAVREPCREKEY